MVFLADSSERIDTVKDEDPLTGVKISVRFKDPFEVIK